MVEQDHVSGIRRNNVARGSEFGMFSISCNMFLESFDASSLNRQVLFYVGSHLRFGKWTLRCRCFSGSGTAVIVLQHDGQLQVGVFAAVRE